MKKINSKKLLTFIVAFLFTFNFLFSIHLLVLTPLNFLLMIMS